MFQKPKFAAIAFGLAIGASGAAHAAWQPVKPIEFSEVVLVAPDHVDAVLDRSQAWMTVRRSRDCSAHQEISRHAGYVRTCWNLL